MSKEPTVSAKDWPQNLWEDITQTSPWWAERNDELNNPSIIFTPNLDSILEAALDERQQKVIRMRFEQGMTYLAIGEVFGVGLERARQIKNDAVRKLREPKYYLRLGAVPKIEVRRLQSEVEELTRQKEELEKQIEILSGLVSADEAKKAVAQVDASLGTPISELDLPIRALNCLKARDIKTIGELLGYTKSGLQEIRNLGAKSAMDIERALNERGYELKREYEKAEG